MYPSTCLCASNSTSNYFPMIMGLTHIKYRILIYITSRITKLVTIFVITFSIHHSVLYVVAIIMVLADLMV